jgi:hypothetical protein
MSFGENVREKEEKEERKKEEGGKKMIKWKVKG